MPRISPASNSELSPEQGALLDQFPEGMKTSHLLRTLLRQPRAVRALMPWSAYIASRTSLAPRMREILILRTCHACRADYEWAHHAEAGRRAGLSDAEIAALGSGDAGSGWSKIDSALIEACDELVSEQRVKDETWQRLAEFLQEGQLMELVFTIAQYLQMAIITNAFGVELETEVSGI